jgi:2-oxoglutarate dehydrogenase complex dehydrogenase (E1) component-like enzyme
MWEVSKDGGCGAGRLVVVLVDLRGSIVGGVLTRVWCYCLQDAEIWAGAAKLDSTGPLHSHIAHEETPGVRRLIFCSGQVYYDLLAARTENDIKDVALARIEQLSPFPFDLVQQFADNFPNAEISWVQEEPRNQGAWTYIEPRMETALTKSKHHDGERPAYIGRKPSASTATGDKTIHKRELKAFLTKAFAE